MKAALVVWLALVPLATATLLRSQYSHRRVSKKTPPLCVLPTQKGFSQAVNVYANAADNTRMVQFDGDGPGDGDQGFIQTMVKCKGDIPQSCNHNGTQACTECPCETDLNGTTYGEYQKHMASYLLPLCKKPPNSQLSPAFRVLLIGLGGGALPQCILNNCPAGTEVETVEYDPRMIEAATRFFGLHLQDGVLEAEQGDGGEIVAQRAGQGQKYDMVLVDAFSGPFQVPESCRSVDFIHNLRRILRANGMVLQNIDMGQFEKTLPLYAKEFGEDSVSSERLIGGGELAVGHLIVAEAPWDDLKKLQKA